MFHPEWALKHKKKNMELRNIRGRYYLYEITSKRVKGKKWPQKITLGQIGVITKEEGLIPTGMKRKGRVPAGKSVYKEGMQPPESETSFLDNFAELSDPRSERNQLYRIEEILLLSLCASLCGAEGWQDVEDFGKLKIRYLRQYLNYENGTPSDDTLRRFYRNINPDEFEKLFREWVGGIAKKAQVKVIAIDGKSVRRSRDEDAKMLHVISAFATEARMVLGQEKVSEKSNEITAIPILLTWLDVKGHIVTIDAMGCQFTIANQIIEKGGNYIFSLKGNQGNLSEDVVTYFDDKESVHTMASHVDYDKGHGRIETRECWVVDDVEWLKKRHPKWSSIRSIIKIHSLRKSKERTEDVRYYISSLTDTPEKILKSIRSHWAIENTLHWVLDMSFNEDYSRIRKGNAPYAMAIIRHVALNLLQLAKAKNQSIKRLRKMCGWDDHTLDLVVQKKSS
jgi:predicted transposase YbfD/YdcC